jgi:uncharacterized protein (TIGR00255 family)
MIVSMTGYGQGQFTGDNFVIAVTLKSVNNRHFDVNLRLSSELQPLENTIKSSLKEKLVRGSLSASVVFSGTGETAIKVNEPLAAAYLHAAREIRDRYHLESELSVESLLRLPNVVTVGNGDLLSHDQIKEKYGSALDQAMQAAIDGVMSMRAIEGKEMEKDLRGRAESIARRIELIEKRVLSASERICEKLNGDIARLIQAASVDPARLAQEVAYLAEKSDVTEEIIRLKSHVQQFLALLDGAGEVGKKLDFLLQEMNREANTILSKTSSVPGDAREASDHAIEIKSDIEKLREQAQNVV